MKLTDSLDRACTHRMKTAARSRLLLLAIVGLAVVAPLLSCPAVAAVAGEEARPPMMVASAGLLGGFL
ncbi:MAG TPA: hypothetical protein PLA50_02675, partial [Bacteroidia bacterium]|nr:hypothetical protein [Bacteroidia bacterium]